MGADDHATTDVEERCGVDVDGPDDGGRPPAVEIHTLEDEPGRVYVVALPPDQPEELVQAIATAFQRNLSEATPILVTGDVDSDLAIAELSEGALDQIAAERRAALTGD